MAETPRPLPGGGWFAWTGGEALPLPLPPRPPTPPAPPAPRAEGRSARRAAGGLAALHLALGGVALAVPAALAEHILPMPPLRPFPGALPAVLGLAEAGDAPALVLDLAAPAGGGEPGAPEWLLVLQAAGRRIGLPAQRIAAGPATPALGIFEAWLASPQAAPALAAAPLSRPAAPPAPQAERALVLFRAGGVTAALPAEAVAAVLAPQRPLPAPPGAAVRGVAGLAAHRGAVLPVRDGGRALGGPPALAGGEAPLIRLALEPEWLLAVSEVLGVRRAPETEIVPAGGGLVTAIARLGGEALPLLAPRGLAA